MENRVGKKRLTEAQARAYAEALAEIRRKKLGPFTLEVTADERRRMLRMRANGETIAQAIADTAERMGLVLPGISPGDIRDDLEAIARLEAVRSEAQQLLDVLEGTLLRARHEAWSGATAYYTALSRMAVVDREVETAIGPVREYFATGPRAKAPGERQAPAEEDKPAA